MTPLDLPFPTGTLRAHPPADVALAIGTAALVMAGSALALRTAALGEKADAPEIDIGTGGVVRVTPVLDAPLLKLGGGRAEELPKSWTRSPPKRPPALASAGPAGARTGATPEAPDARGETTGDTHARSDAGSPEEEATSRSAEDGGAVLDSPSPEVDGGIPGGVPGPGSPSGSPEGTSTDPLAARALDVYRARLVVWFSSRFRVSGSGLPQSTLVRLKAPATVQIGSDGRVTGYSLGTSGNPVFDAAARAALESSRGQAIPPPPENYPDLAPPSISVTFVCTEGKCD